MRKSASVEARLLRDIVHHATMAASSHNTQPWKFALAERSIVIGPDFSRRTPVVDPDDHHLFVSLGCATENLVHAALAKGLHAEAAVDREQIRVTLDDTRPVRSTLFDAIPSRQCSRSLYNGEVLPEADIRTLEQAWRRPGVDVLLITEKRRIEDVLEYVTRANEAQMRDPAFVGELRDWIRFNEADASRTRDGLFSRCTGNPSVPRWFGRWFLRLLLTPRSENDKVAAQVRSSAGLAIFVAQTSDRAHWIEVGRAYERFALQATALGVRNAFINQPVEIASIRSELGVWLGVSDRRPDLVVRFGRGPQMPRSLRRPVADVLISPSHRQWRQTAGPQ